MRLLVDYFSPYFLLVEGAGERGRMSAALSRAIAQNVAAKPGAQGAIQPDGTTFHYASACMGACGPFAPESCAELLYVAQGLAGHTGGNVAAVKLALEADRVMVQKYSVTSALRGRQRGDHGDRPTMTVSKAMPFRAHPDGSNDDAMRARFLELLRPPPFLAGARQPRLVRAQVQAPIRGLGIYRLVADLPGPGIAAAPTPQGVWITPTAAAAFFRPADWLVSARGLRQNFWDFDGQIRTLEHSFVQNWPYGVLQGFSAGSPVRAPDSGHDLDNGWDWCQEPGPTASHYPIEERSLATRKCARDPRESSSSIRSAATAPRRSWAVSLSVTTGLSSMTGKPCPLRPLPTCGRARPSASRGIGCWPWVRTSTDARRPTRRTRLSSRPVRGPRSRHWARRDLADRSRGLDPSDSEGDGGDGRQRRKQLLPGGQHRGSRGGLWHPEEHVGRVRAERGGLRAGLPRSRHPPDGHSYEYVLFPADRGAQKLREQAADPSAHHRVVRAGRMHQASFPARGVTDYTFYESVETPLGQSAPSASWPAAVMAHQAHGSTRMAVGAPDIGWSLGNRINAQGTDYGSRRIKRQAATEHAFEVVLRGKLSLSDSPSVPDSEAVG